MKKCNRYIVFIVGIIILTLGVALEQKSGLGVGPWDALNFGLANTFGLTPGNWMIILSIGVLILAAIINKGYPKVFSFITVVLVGKFIDLWVYLIKGLDLKQISLTYGINENILNYGVFFIGTLILAFGVAMYLLPRLPENPVDHLMVTIQDKWNMKVAYAKLLIDGTCFILALVLHGPIWIGTILALVLVGPGVGFFQKMMMGTYEKITGEDDKDVKEALDMEMSI